MEIVWKIVYTFLVSGLELFIFFKVDGIGLTFERIFKAFLLKFLLAAIVTTFNYLVLTDYLSYFIEPLFGLSLSFLLLRGLSKRLLFFYGLFPIVLMDIFYRSLSYFVFPFFGARDCRWRWKSSLFVDYAIRLLHSISLFEMVGL